MQRLGQDFPSTTSAATIKEYRGRVHSVQIYMGSMALCRGERGDLLREAGAMSALLFNLSSIKNNLPDLTETSITLIDDDSGMDTESWLLENAVVDLAIACWGAIRDLACGNAMNRNYLHEEKGGNGLSLLAFYLERYHNVPWTTVASSKRRELRLLTNIIGALRNVTHSNCENCEVLHNLKVSDMLRWRLLQGDTHDEDNNNAIVLPDATKPWREGAYRAAGTLINLAEKCEDCALMCGSDRVLVELLIEAWGGNAKQKSQAPLLHLGLAAILHAAKEELSNDSYDERWDEILDKEKERKRAAQRKEEERKQRQMAVAQSRNY